MKVIILFCGLAWVGLTCVSCDSPSGAGAAAGGSSAPADTVSFTGSVLITSTSSHGFANNFSDPMDDTINPYSHVNLCTVSSSGTFQTVPGTPTVVAGSNGTYTLTINRSNLPTSGSVAVCVSSPGGQYEMYALIPSDLLPTQSNEIATVAMNVTGETTLITLFLCSKALLTFSANHACKILEQDLITLENALDAQGQAPIMPMTAPEWNSFFKSNGASSGNNTTYANAIQAWGQGQGFGSGWLTWALMNGIPTQANNFNQVQPITKLVSQTDPSGTWIGSYTTSSPAQCAGMGGSWTATMNALGSNLVGTWSSSNGSGGALSGNTIDGSLTYQVGGSGGASFGGTISGGGLAIGGGWSGGTHCVNTGTQTDYGATSGSFSGGRN